MKLYATVTSERASKGQGGNEYIAIQLKDEGKKIILTIAMDFDALGQWHIAKVFGEYRACYELEKKAIEGQEIAIYEAEKGERQKGKRTCKQCAARVKTSLEEWHCSNCGADN